MIFERKIIFVQKLIVIGKSNEFLTLSEIQNDPNIGKAYTLIDIKNGSMHERRLKSVEYSVKYLLSCTAYQIFSATRHDEPANASPCIY